MQKPVYLREYRRTIGKQTDKETTVAKSAFSLKPFRHGHAPKMEKNSLGTMQANPEHGVAAVYSPACGAY